MVLASVSSFAQFQKLVVEEVDNKGLVPGKTFRVYALMSGPNDHVHAVFATEGHDLYVRSSTSFYQHKYGNATTAGLNPALVADNPDLAFDSWLTIGMDESNLSNEDPKPMEAGGEATFFENTLNLMTLDTKTFESGGPLEVADGAWFCIPTMEQIKAGDDNRVLLMQLTSDGKIDGKISLQGMYPVAVRTEEGMQDFQQSWQEFDLEFTCE